MKETRNESACVAGLKSQFHVANHLAKPPGLRDSFCNSLGFDINDNSTLNSGAIFDGRRTVMNVLSCLTAMTGAQLATSLMTTHPSSTLWSQMCLLDPTKSFRFS
jgi:hypothetical protein